MHRNGEKRDEICNLNPRRSDSLISDPDKRIESAVDFQKARIEMAQGHYETAITHLDKGWLQNKYFEAIFLNGRIKTMNTENQEPLILTGLMEMVDACNGYFDWQMMEELQETLEYAVRKGIINGPVESPGGTDSKKDINKIYSGFFGILQLIKSSRDDIPFVKGELTKLLAQLTELLA